jgi:hypothetical protein
MLSWCSSRDSCKKMSGIMNNLNTMLKSITEKPISEDTLNERVNMEDTLYDLINQYIIDNELEITYEGVKRLLVDLPIVKETIKRMYIMHYKEMGNERYKEVSSVINTLNDSAYIMSIAEIMCDNEGPSFMFDYTRLEIEEQIAKCYISESSNPRNPLPGSKVVGTVRTYDPLPIDRINRSMKSKGPMERDGPMGRGGKGKMRKTASKRKKSAHRSTKRRLHTRKHGNKKNKRHVKKHTKRA